MGFPLAGTHSGPGCIAIRFGQAGLDPCHISGTFAEVEEAILRVAGAREAKTETVISLFTPIRSIKPKFFRFFRQFTGVIPAMPLDLCPDFFDALF
jgi:hypothetical protein